MKRLVTLIIGILFVSGVSFAQDLEGRTSLGIGFDLSLPTGDLSDALDLSTGIGGDLRIEHRFSERVSGHLFSGINYYNGNVIGLNELEVDTELTLIPIVGGAKIYVNRGFYGLLEAGIHFLSYDFGDDNDIMDMAETSDEKFGAAFGAGYEVPLSYSMALDLSAKYKYIEDFSNVVFRVGIVTIL